MVKMIARTVVKFLVWKKKKYVFRESENICSLLLVRHGYSWKIIFISVWIWFGFCLSMARLYTLLRV